jgi:trimeric autotransporter adhesin
VTRDATGLGLRKLARWTAFSIIAGCAGAVTDATPVATIATVAINPPSTSVPIGTQFPLQAVVTDVDGKLVPQPTVVWTVRDTAIASVSPTGVVQGRALGTTEVAANVGGRSGIASIIVQRTPVASVVVGPSHVDVVVGARPQLTGTAYDAANVPLPDRPIFWSSSDITIATVDTTGIVAALAPGTATITATAEGKSAAATVTVAQVPVASLAITPNSLSMSVGQSTQLADTARDASGNVLAGRTVSWASSNPAAASVSATGSLTALAAGSTTITATCEGATATAAVTVSNFAVASVTVQPLTTSVTQNGTTQLSTTVRDVNGAIVADRVITWSSSSSAIATVTATGLVTGVAPGSATITATSEGKSGTATVTVNPIPVATVTVAPASVNVIAGQTTTLVPTLKDAGGNVLTGRVVTWTSSATNVVTVSPSGVLTAVAPGTATVTATSEGKTGVANVTVTPPPVAAVAIAPPASTVAAGQTVTLAATTTDAGGNVLTGRVVTWASSNTAVASVSSVGVVTGKKTGSATITATSEGKSGTATVTVQAGPAAVVVVAPRTATLVVGQKLTIVATATDALGNAITGRAFTWHSSNSSTASVDATGVVTAKRSGTITVSATLDGKSDVATLTIR